METNHPFKNVHAWNAANCAIFVRTITMATSEGRINDITSLISPLSSSHSTLPRPPKSLGIFQRCWQPYPGIKGPPFYRVNLIFTIKLLATGKQSNTLWNWKPNFFNKEKLQTFPKRFHNEKKTFAHPHIIPDMWKNDSVSFFLLSIYVFHYLLLLVAKSPIFQLKENLFIIVFLDFFNRILNFLKSVAFTFKEQVMSALKNYGYEKRPENIPVKLS